MSKVTENFQLYLKATESAAIAAAKLRGNGDGKAADKVATEAMSCLLYTSPSPRDRQKSRMPSSA